jgi:serine/threonine-protein kinase
LTDSSTANHPVTERVALFGAAWAGISAFGVLVHLVTTLVLGHATELIELPFAVHAATVLIPLAMWIACRKPRPRAFARIVEAAGLIGTAAAMGLMAAALAHDAPKPEGLPAAIFADIDEDSYERYAQIMVFASAMMFTVRSALVPSPMLHTLALGVAMGAAKIAVLVLGYHPLPGAAGSPRANLAVSTASSWVLAVAVCAMLSAVIYGLHQQIEKARKIGQYTLEEKIGEGGMGVVYRARHAMLRRPTAIKLLPRERLADDAVRRFEREVQLTAELTHPNTITVYDYGRTPDGLFYYAMELLHGPSLETVVEKSGPQPAARVVHVLRMVAGALTEAHGRGLIHRDIKPANIVLSERGGMLDVATILDFGLVHEIDPGAPSDTLEGRIVGTPLYLAPEVILSAKAAGPRSDLYALGAVGYFMLTGKPVFDGNSVVEVCGHHLHSPVVPPSKRVDVPPALEALIVQCLAKDPEARPESAAAFAGALASIDLSPWTADDARRWWAEHPYQPQRAPTPSSISMTVDLTERAASTRS